MKKYLLASALIATGLLAACATVEDEMPRFQAMSCSQLNAEISKWDDRLSDAKVDTVVSGIEVLAGDDDSELDMDIAEMEADEAKEYLAALKQVRAEKRCR